MRLASSNLARSISLYLAGLLAVAPLAHAQKRIAITIDDVPVASTVAPSMNEEQAINSKILGVLSSNKVPAIGFVNEDRLYRQGHLDEGVAILDEWLRAGMELGNHTYGHVGLWQTPLSEVEEAVIKGEVITRWLTASRGVPFRFYRHPYTQTGNSEEEKGSFELFLASHGYKVAPFTIEHDDYVYACVYDKVYGDSGDRERVIGEYLRHLDVALDTYELMSQALLGRQVAQILLIHDSRLNADSLQQTLQRLTDRGYVFISLEDALSDPAYLSKDLHSGKFGPSWIARWARERHEHLPVYGQPDPVGWVAEQYARRCTS